MLSVRQLKLTGMKSRVQTRMIFILQHSHTAQPGFLLYYGEILWDYLLLIKLSDDHIMGVIF